MLKNSFVTFLSILLLGVCSVEAAVSKNKLMSIAKKQEILSVKLISDYKSKSLMETITSIEKGNEVLQKNISDTKVRNMIHYLDTCIIDLKKLAEKPYTKENAHTISEISLLMAEGSHYMQDRIK